MNKPRLIAASAFAATLSIVFVVVITIWAEASAPLKDWLKAFSGHHWTSKSIFSVLIYAIFTAAFYPLAPDQNSRTLDRALTLLLAAVFAGTVALFGFFTGHHFGYF